MRRRRHLGRAVAAATLLVVVGTATVPLLAVTGGSTLPPLPGPIAGIPARVLSAYQATDKWCEGLRWQLVAAIGQVESGHGTTGRATVDPGGGQVTPWIFGPPLDGTGGTQRIPVGQWLGWWGLAGPWEHAVGPMQFRAPTFDRWAVDADGDNVANPHDIDDAATSGANYLCGGPEGAITSERDAVLRYNNSAAYADEVLAIADQLANSAVDSEGRVCPVAGPVSFTDTWGAPRPGGRIHEGVDMFTNHGTPVVAPVAGTIEHRSNTVGGLSFHLWGDDGNYYYGAHLSAYGLVTGWVAARIVIGHVGSSGNAAGTSPALAPTSTSRSTPTEGLVIHPPPSTRPPPSPACAEKVALRSTLHPTQLRWNDTVNANEQ